MPKPTSGTELDFRRLKLRALLLLDRLTLRRSVGLLAAIIRMSRRK